MSSNIGNDWQQDVELAKTRQCKAVYGVQMCLGRLAIEIDWGVGSYKKNG